MDEKEYKPEWEGSSCHQRHSWWLWRSVHNKDGSSLLLLSLMCYSLSLHHLHLLDTSPTQLQTTKFSPNKKKKKTWRVTKKKQNPPRISLEIFLTTAKPSQLWQQQQLMGDSKWWGRVCEWFDEVWWPVNPFFALFVFFFLSPFCWLLFAYPFCLCVTMCSPQVPLIMMINSLLSPYTASSFSKLFKIILISLN